MRCFAPVLSGPEPRAVDPKCVTLKLLLLPSIRRARPEQSLSWRMTSVEKTAQRGRVKSAPSTGKPAKGSAKVKAAANETVPAVTLHAYRSATCGALRKPDAGQTVRLSG